MAIALSHLETTTRSLWCLSVAPYRLKCPLEKGRFQPLQIGSSGVRAGEARDREAIYRSILALAQLDYNRDRAIDFG